MCVWGGVKTFPKIYFILIHKHTQECVERECRDLQRVEESVGYPGVGGMDACDLRT